MEDIQFRGLDDDSMIALPPAPAERTLMHAEELRAALYYWARQVGVQLRLIESVIARRRGARPPLERARQMALAHQKELDAFFMDQDGRPAGHELSLRLRLLVRGVWALPSGLGAQVKLARGLARAVERARQAAIRLATMRAMLDGEDRRVG